MRMMNCFLLAIYSTGTLSGAAFQNLGFEKARLPNKPTPGESLAISVALPGWGVDLEETPQNVVSYNDMAISSPSATLWDREISANYPFQGRFFAQINTGLLDISNPDERRGSSSLYQQGEIPSSARSILFTAAVGRPSNLEVQLDGTPLQLIEIGVDPLQTRFGADISGWAGRNAELRFTIYPNSRTQINSLILDDISFSIASVPEPSTYVLLAAGTLFLGATIKRRR